MGKLEARLVALGEQPEPAYGGPSGRWGAGWPSQSVISFVRHSMEQAEVSQQQLEARVEQLKAAAWRRCRRR
jgi:hypothetical protein